MTLKSKTFCSMLAVLVAVVCLGIDLRAEKKDEDQKKLQGTWLVTALTLDGTENDKLDAKIEFTFKDDQLTIKRPNEEDMKATVKLTGDAKPKMIDLKMTEGPEKGKDVEGIFEIKEDELKLCVGKPDQKNRPTEFASKAGSETYLLILKRQKP